MQIQAVNSAIQISSHSTPKSLSQFGESDWFDYISGCCKLYLKHIF